MALAIQNKDKIECAPKAKDQEEAKEESKEESKEETMELPQKKSKRGGKKLLQLAQDKKNQQKDDNNEEEQKNEQAQQLDPVLKDLVAEDDDVEAMVADVTEFCRSSGCSLIEVLYAINEVLPDEKRFFTTGDLIDIYN